jgi:hypothetical protein
MNSDAAEWSKVGGYIKLSASFNREGETPIELKEDHEPDLAGSRPCIMPESVQPKFKQLIMNMYCAEHLPKLDKQLFNAGKMDAYLKTKIGTRSLETSMQVAHEKGGMKCDWNERFMVPVQLPIMSNMLTVGVWDEDNVTDELAGSLHFNLK